MAVLFGRHNLNTLHERGSLSKTVNRIFVHQDWRTSNENWDADIAILHLEEAVKYSKYIQPVCLPSNIISGTTEGIVVRKCQSFECGLFRQLQVGWGKSEVTQLGNLHEAIPRQVALSSVNGSACYTADPAIAAMSSLRTFCAGGKNSGPCTGDSGI